MIKVLHRYVLRELLKTFVLTATGLTLMFAMGGGLQALIRADQVSATDVARLFWWFIPLVASFMLPIAALLSCALVYGRLAADNELDACKASGVNILRLLASAVGLALTVGLVSGYLSNFTVPHLFRQIQQLIGGDIPSLVVAQLKDQGHCTLPGERNMHIYADDARPLTEEAAARVLGEHDPQKDVVLIEGAVFVEFRGEDPMLTGTAEKIVLVFDKSRDPMAISARMIEARVFDHQRLQFMAMPNPRMDVAELPDLANLRRFGRMQVKFLDLAELYQYYGDPVSSPQMQDGLRRFREGLAGLALAREVRDSLRDDSVAVLTDESGQKYRMRASQIRLVDVGRQAQVEMRRPVLEQIREDGSRIYKADEGSITFQTGAESVTAAFSLSGNVTLQDSSEMDRLVQQSSPWSPPSIAVPLDRIDRTRLAVYSDSEILDLSNPLPLPEVLQKMRGQLAGGMSDMRRKITATLHSRITMSVSTMVLVVLAAALGIVIRGGHALTAFGVAFIPTIIVVLVITTGRQLAEHPGMTGTGIAVMWGVLGIMAVVDAVIVFGGIRR